MKKVMKMARYTIRIKELIDNDFDYVGWEPEVADDSDAEMAEQLGY